MKTGHCTSEITPEILCSQIKDVHFSTEEAMEILLFLRKMAQITVKRYLAQ